MANLNWFLQIKNLSKTDSVAAELYEQLQKAQTDEEKDTAKENAKNYIQKIQSDDTGLRNKNTDAPAPSNMDSEEDRTDSGEVYSETSDKGNPEDRTESENESPQEEQEKSKIMDLGAPAFNPRLAKCGITREEELFLKGVCVRKLSREEKLLMRRAIYQKKTVRNAQIQAEFKAKRIEQKIKDANDPEKQRFHLERKTVGAITDALSGHKNIGWILANIEGVTVDVLREFIKKPAYANAFRIANPEFISNFKKRFGE